MILRNFWPVFLTLLISACASSGVQTRALLESPPHIPRQVQLEKVPFVEQTERGYCGPSSLAMALQSAGDKTSVETLAQEIYAEDRQGTLQADLIAASRRRGLLAVQIDGLADMLTEIAAGHPVIVFENLTVSWWPQWHYSVAVGYDLDKQELVRHSGSDAYLHESLNRFERGWRLADYWGLVVLPPSELAVGAGEIGNLQGAVGLEQSGHSQEAERVYKSILKQWPTSLGARIGLGNLAYRKKNFAEAEMHLKRAVKNHPHSEAARHNLKVVRKAL